MTVAILQRPTSGCRSISPLVVRLVIFSASFSKPTHSKNLANPRSFQTPQLIEPYGLPTAHCPLPTAHCPLPTAHCPLTTAQSLNKPSQQHGTVHVMILAGLEGDGDGSVDDIKGSMPSDLARIDAQLLSSASVAYVSLLAG